MSLWINGEWITGQGEALEKRDPVGGGLLWQGHAADDAQVQAACAAARAAFPAWAKRPFADRQAIAEKFAALLEANKTELTRIIALETANRAGSGHRSDRNDQ